MYLPLRLKLLPADSLGGVGLFTLRDKNNLAEPHKPNKPNKRDRSYNARKSLEWSEGKVSADASMAVGPAGEIVKIVAPDVSRV